MKRANCVVLLVLAGCSPQAPVTVVPPLVPTIVAVPTAAPVTVPMRVPDKLPETTAAAPPTDPSQDGVISNVPTPTSTPVELPVPIDARIVEQKALEKYNREILAQTPVDQNRIAVGLELQWKAGRVYPGTMTFKSGASIPVVVYVEGNAPPFKFITTSLMAR